jgi:hypothetical protein
LCICRSFPYGLVGFTVLLQLGEEDFVVLCSLVAELEVALLKIGVETFEDFAFSRGNTMAERLGVSLLRFPDMDIAGGWGPKRSEVVLNPVGRTSTSAQGRLRRR